jgi:hypothetical protein
MALSGHGRPLKTASRVLERTAVSDCRQPEEPQERPGRPSHRLRPWHRWRPSHQFPRWRRSRLKRRYRPSSSTSCGDDGACDASSPSASLQPRELQAPELQPLEPQPPVRPQPEALAPALPEPSWSRRRAPHSRSSESASYQFLLYPFVPWRLCFAGRISDTLAIAVPSKNPSQTGCK